MNSRRAESFSDGVFAVAITVLVFNLLPIADATDGTGSHSLTAGHLLSHWPAYLAYLISFLTIGIMWLNHHSVLAAITRVDRPILVVNLLLLMGVVAVPFPTALVADHLNDGPAGKVAAVSYGLVMMLISVSYGAMWLYLNGRRHQLGGAEVAVPTASTIRFTAGNGGYVIGTVVALFVPVAGMVVFALLAVYYLFEHLGARAEDSDAE